MYDKYAFKCLGNFESAIYNYSTKSKATVLADVNDCWL
jgi:hypothetical protein